MQELMLGFFSTVQKKSMPSIDSILKSFSLFHKMCCPLQAPLWLAHFSLLYGLKTSPKLWQQHLSKKLEELGLRKNKADPCIFMGEKLLVMTYVDDLLIVGEKQEQEAFLAKLSAQFPLEHQTKLDAKTPLTFLGKLVEYNQQEHSISLHLPTAYYQKLFKLYGLESAKPASTTGDKLG